MDDEKTSYWAINKYSILGVSSYFLLTLFSIISFLTGFHPLLFEIFGIITFATKFIASKNDLPTVLKRLEFLLFAPNMVLMFGYLVSILWQPFALIGIIFSLITLSFTFGMSFSSKKDELADYMEADMPDVLDTDNTDEIEPGDFVIGNMYKHNLDDDGKVPDGEDAYIETQHKAFLPLHDRFVHVIVLGVTGSGKTSQTLLPMFVQDFDSDNFDYEDVSVVQLGQILLEPKGDFAKTAWAIGKIKEPEKRKNYMKFLMAVPKKIKIKLAKLAVLRNNYLKIKNGVPLSKEEQRELELGKKKLATETFTEDNQNEMLDLQSKVDELTKRQNGSELSKTDEIDFQLTEKAMKQLLYIQKKLPKVIDLTDFSSLNDMSSFALFRYSALLTDVISNDQLREAAWNNIEIQDPHEERDLVLLFDPSARNSAYFNPMYGDEDVAVATVTTTLLAFMADSSDYFQNMAKTLTQNAIHVAKQVYGNDATLMHVNDLMTNNGGRGDQMLKKLTTLAVSPTQTLANKDLAAYFLNDYYSGIKGGQGASKTYEQTSGVRTILNNLLDNDRIRKVLNPPAGIGTSIDFDKILEVGDKVALSTATGVSDELGKMLGSFLILQLQAAIFRRPGTENTRIPVILYIDEFQDYASSSFEDVLTKGRSYVVSATMATQTLGIVEEKAGEGLVSNLQSNARNVICYPGASADDAKYFVDLFGTVQNSETKRSVSQAVDDDDTIARKVHDALQLPSGGDSAPAPRESVSTEINDADRFTTTQIIYGPNVYQRGKASEENDPFGSIFYRIVKNNSNQVPAVAKIAYMPRWLKDESDAKIRAYDSANSLTDADAQSISDDKTQETNADPFSGETQSNADKVAEEAKTSIKKDETEDPAKLSRDKESAPIDGPDLPEVPDIPDGLGDISGMPDLSGDPTSEKETKPTDSKKDDDGLDDLFSGDASLF